jgi:hypothetical protein
MKSKTKGIAGPRGRPALGLTPKQESKLAEIWRDFPSRARPFEQAYSGRSKAAALKAFCLYCMGYDSKEVGKCSAEDCPL